jgi:uncharacterized protein
MSSSSSKRLHQTGAFFAWPIWVILGFGVAQLSVGLVWRAFSSVTSGAVDLGSDTVATLIVAALAYVAALVFVIGVPRLLFEKSVSLRQLLGIKGGLKTKHAIYAVAAYGVYFVATVSFALIVQGIWKDFPIDEVQQVGFGNLVVFGDYIAAFVALVIIPPIAEELLFRGYLYGKLRQTSNFLVSAIMTSIIFGLVHLQWNVGIDVFILSIVLCYLREKTGTIWAGVLLHMIKNTVAFVVLFLQPHLVRIALDMFFQ